MAPYLDVAIRRVQPTATALEASPASSACLLTWHRIRALSLAVQTRSQRPQPPTSRRWVLCELSCSLLQVPARGLLPLQQVLKFTRSRSATMASPLHPAFNSLALAPPPWQARSTLR